MSGYDENEEMTNQIVIYRAKNRVKSMFATQLY